MPSTKGLRSEPSPLQDIMRPASSLPFILDIPRSRKNNLAMFAIISIIDIGVMDKGEFRDWKFADIQLMAV